MSTQAQAKLKELEKFKALWAKFHDIYRKSSNHKSISTDDEKEFSETKQVVARRYNELLALLNKNPHPDHVKEVLKVISVTTTSDKILTKMQADGTAASLMFNDWRKELMNSPASGGFLSRIFRR